MLQYLFIYTIHFLKDQITSFDKYHLTIGVSDFDLSLVKESISFLLEGNIDYEFRTTVTKNFHTIDDIENICSAIKGTKKYFIQNFVDSGNIIGDNLMPVNDDTLSKMLLSARKFVQNAQIR